MSDDEALSPSTTRSYGRTSGGVEVTDALVERLVDEAERGYDLDRLSEILRDSGDRGVDGVRP